jgi:hypothetical protein
VAALLLACLVGAGVHRLAGRLGPLVVDPKNADAWFDADANLVLPRLADRWARSYRIEMHPILPLLTLPPAWVAQRAFGLSPLDAARAFFAAVGALWVAALYALVRVIGCRRPDAAVFSLLACASAAAVFWLPVPESWQLGSLSLLLALVPPALAQRREVAVAWYVPGSFLTLGVTVSNWTTGVAAALGLGWRRAAGVTLLALSLVLTLSVAQVRLLPNAPALLGSWTSPAVWRNEMDSRWVFRPDARRTFEVARSFLFHSMVAPEVRRIPHWTRPWLAVLATQPARPGSAGAWSVVAVALWTALLGVGAWSILALRTHGALRLALGLSLLAQLGVHFAYGSETFLYSLHFAPLLVVAAALGCLTRARPLVLGLAAALAVCAAVNNATQLERAVSELRGLRVDAEAQRGAGASR